MNSRDWGRQQVAQASTWLLRRCAWQREAYLRLPSRKCSSDDAVKGGGREREREIKRAVTRQARCFGEESSTGRCDDVLQKKQKAAMMVSVGSSGPNRSGVAAPSKRETEENRRKGHNRKKCRCDPPGGRNGLVVSLGDEAGIWSFEETRQQQDGHSVLQGGGPRRRRRRDGWQELFLFRSPALGTAIRSGECENALLAMVKGGWREWRSPVGECLARSSAPLVECPEGLLQHKMQPEAEPGRPGGTNSPRGHDAGIGWTMAEVCHNAIINSAHCCSVCVGRAAFRYKSPPLRA